MGVLNIICAIVLILASIAVIALVSMQESKRGMSALTGGQSEAIGRNYGRTRDAMLSKGADRGAVRSDDHHFHHRQVLGLTRAPKASESGRFFF